MREQSGCEPERAMLPAVDRASAVRSNALLVLPALLAAGLCAYALASPGVLSGVYGYDDGVYVGAAVRLVQGIVPYRDFVLVQPPGIVVLLAPVALFSRIFGTDGALAAARILTAVVTVANVLLLGRLLRPRGRLASLAGGSALALFPLAVAADNTVLLEPYVAFFCLLGGLVAFPAGRLAGPRRCLLAGGLLGVAGTVKLSALLVGVALLACVLFGRHWREAGAIVGGIAAAGVLLCGPFALAGPSAFARDVVLTQLRRASAGARTVPIGARIGSLTGLSGLPGLHPGTVVPVVVLVVAVGLGACCLLAGRGHLGHLDGFLATAAGLSLAATIWSTEFFAHYAYLPAVFSAGLAGISAGHLSTFVHRPRRPAVPGSALGASSVEPDRPERGRRLLPVVLGLAVVLAASALFTEDVIYAGQYVRASDVRSPQLLLGAAVPPGSCVVSDEPALTLAADRFVATSPTCPAMVDPYGTWLVDAPGHPPPTTGPPPRRLVAQWTGWLAASDYVLLTAPLSDFVPWTPALRSRFARSEALVAEGPSGYLYLNTSSRVGRRG